MRRAAPLAIALLLALGLAPAAEARPASVGTGDRSTELREDAARADRPLSADGRWIVVLEDGTSTTAEAGRAKARGVKVDRTFTSIRGYAARLTKEQVAALRADPVVAAVVPDEVDQHRRRPERAAGRQAGRRPREPGRGDRRQRRAGGCGRRDRGHGHRARPTRTSTSPAAYNCSTDDPTAWGDVNGHGTHVAGTVGALDNGVGVVGVAPGARLWAVRILNSAGDGLLSWYVCGLDWITAQRDPADPTRPLIEAVNMSVAKSGTDDGNCGLTNKDVMHQAVCRVVAPASRSWRRRATTRSTRASSARRATTRSSPCPRSRIRTASPAA